MYYHENKKILKMAKTLANLNLKQNKDDLDSGNELS